MLEKTLAMLDGFGPGTYLPDNVECFDPAELERLGPLLQRLMYAPSSIRRFLQQKYDVTITRGDHYSEIPTIQELERSFATPSRLDLSGIFPDSAGMVEELERLTRVSHEFDPPRQSAQPGEFAWDNGDFSYSDAMAYYAMIRTRRPRTIVEVGGGWATRIAQIACQRNGMGRIVSVAPTPNEVLDRLQGIEVVNSPVQNLDVDFFNALLRDGDMLFIDSSHTVKHDSDCLHLYLRILPALRADVTVQLHDICLPDTLAIEQMRDSQVFWNEQYLLYAYWLGNPRVRTLYGSRYHQKNNPDLLHRFMHGRFGSGGGSFWFEQKAG